MTTPPEELNDIAKALREPITPTVEQRPDHGDPRQILGPSSLVCELCFEAIEPADARSPFVYEVIDAPFKDTRGVCVTVRRQSDGLIEVRYLADLGIVPYRDGRWNPVNFARHLS